MKGDIFNSKNTIILSPHPDDEALGCSGTIRALRKSSASVHIIYLTKGERLLGEPSEEIARIRVKEAERSSKMLGCKEPVFLDLPDGGLRQCSEELHQRLREIIEAKGPEIVFSPSLIDYHHDHVATAMVALRLLNSIKSFRLAFYEIYETVRFNHLIDISEFVDEKERVIMNYRQSLYERPEVYVHASLGLNAQRSIFTQKKGFYEAFLFIDRPVEEEKVCDYLCYRTDNLYPQD